MAGDSTQHTDDELVAGILSEANAATGRSWQPSRDDAGRLRVRIELPAGAVEWMRVLRERDPASDDDVAFVGHARSDVERLTAAIRGEVSMSGAERHAVRRRVAAASPGPWICHLASDGGVGGPSVIQVGWDSSEPDLYLLSGSERTAWSPMSDRDYEFVAHAHEVIPELLAALEKGASHSAD